MKFIKSMFSKKEVSQDELMAHVTAELVMTVANAPQEFLDNPPKFLEVDFNIGNTNYNLSIKTGKILNE